MIGIFINDGVGVSVHTFHTQTLHIQSITLHAIKSHASYNAQQITKQDLHLVFQKKKKKKSPFKKIFQILWTIIMPRSRRSSPFLIYRLIVTAMAGQPNHGFTRSPQTAHQCRGSSRAVWAVFTPEPIHRLSLARCWAIHQLTDSTSPHSQTQFTCTISLWAFSSLFFFCTIRKSILLYGFFSFFFSVVLWAGIVVIQTTGKIDRILIILS